MIPLASQTATLQGKTYKLRPFSPANYEIIVNKGNELREKLESGEMTRFEYWDALLRIVLEPEHEWDVNSPEFDGREAENAILAFLPPSMQVSVLLTGFHPV